MIRHLGLELQFPILRSSRSEVDILRREMPLGAVNNGFSTVAPLFRALLIGYLLFLPVQVTIGSRTAGFTPWGLRFAPSDLFILAYITLSLYRIRIRPGTWCPVHPIIVVLFGLGAYLGAVRLGSLGGYVLINKLFGLSLLFGTYAVIVDAARSWEDIAQLIRVFIASVASHNIFALVCFFIANIFRIEMDWINYMEVRLAGLLLDPNAYGGLLTVALGAHISTHSSSRRLFSPKVGLLITLSLALGITLTFSRSCWIGFCLGLVFVFLLNRRLAVKIALAALVSLSLLLLAAGPQRREDILHLAQRPEQIMQRVTQINDGVAMLAANPVFGTGLGVFGVLFESIVHNTTFWFLVEFGLVGLATFLFLYLWYVYKGLTAYQRADPRFRPLVLGSLFPHVVMFGVSFGIEAFYQRHWWIFMALISACAALVNTRTYSAQKSTRKSVAT